MSTFVLFLFMLHRFLPTSGYEYAFKKYKKFLEKEVKKDNEKKPLLDKLKELEGDV